MLSDSFRKSKAVLDKSFVLKKTDHAFLLNYSVQYKNKEVSPKTVFPSACSVSSIMYTGSQFKNVFQF